MGRAARTRRRGDRRRRYKGGRARQGRRHVHHDCGHRPADPGRGRARRDRFGPATRSCCRDPSAITASRSCWRAASSISRPSCAPIRAPCCRWWRRWREAPAPGLRWMRDPTRGGVATSLNELARDCGLGVHSSRNSVPVRDGVRGACELLGLDPLHIANEGQFLAVVAPEFARCRRWRPYTRRRAGGGVHHRRSAGAARRRGAGGNALRRHARGGYAGGRSPAQNLLMEFVDDLSH